MKNFLTESLNTPVRCACDVLVAGGGTAGVVAALAAAKNGADTILVERFGFLGGTIVGGAGPLHSFFNLYKAFPGAEKKQVVRGIPEEIIQRLVKAGGSPGHLEQERGGNYDSVITLVDWEIFKQVILEMLEEAGVKILLHTMLAGAVMEGNQVKGVFVQGKSGREAILAKAVVDCTGDGDVAAFAGGQFIKKHDTSAAGYPFGMTGVDMQRLVAFLEERGLVNQLIRAHKGSETDDVIRLGFELKKVPEFSEFMEKNEMWGPLGMSMHENNYTYINAVKLANVDGTDSWELSKAELVLRRRAMALAAMMKAHLPGFENAYVSWTPAAAGIRYTRAVLCEHIMSLEEILSGARFPDEVMLYGFHDCAPRLMIQDGGYYGVPYGALLPKGVDGLLMAGRMLTTEWDAHMSTRNTVSCMAMGQAAGTAAALAAKSGVLPRALDTEQLRDTLKAQDVVL